ncbi:hypothetical protein [Yinghuangia soli]|uniref:Uncharacterized protein n=1 Tax=Yinghuangia soli TaxID=2908204 RepID=A0AA41Q829_9ACTN|nr:hypothetical protein [Yinghuangia soli]MCF2533183.1 hypothetical protein [Yinghuangia soli]
MARSESGTGDEVPLGELFGKAGPVELERMRLAVTALDAARPADQDAEWEWFAEHAQAPVPLPAVGASVVLQTTVGLYESDSDWLELELEVAWMQRGLRVGAVLGVACWCESDNHGTHYLDPMDLDADDGTSIAEAFDAATAQLLAWAGGPRDPSYWRGAAGLPQPTSDTS